MKTGNVQLMTAQVKVPNISRQKKHFEKWFLADPFGDVLSPPVLTGFISEGT